MKPHIRSFQEWLSKLSSKKKSFIIIFFFFLLTIVYTWPMALHMNDQITDAGDPMFVTWVMQRGIKSIKSLNKIDFWNQPSFYPYPNTMAFSDHSLTLTLQALPVSFFTDNSFFLANFTQVVSFFLAGLFAYYLSYFYTKNRKASIVAGIIYGFSPFHVGIVSHIQIASYQYIPLTILFLERFLKNSKTKDLIGFIIAFLLNAFVSIYLLGFILIPIVFITFIRFLTKEIKITRKFIFSSFIGGIITVALIFSLYSPYLSVSSNFNIERDINESIFFGSKIHDFLVAPLNHIYWGGVSHYFFDKNPTAYWPEHTLFFGILTVVSALLGLLSIYSVRKNKTIQFNLDKNKAIYGILFFTGLILSFGPEIKIFKSIISLPYKLLYDYIFIFKAIRVPPRVGVVTLLTIALLASFFIHKLLISKFKFKKIIIVIIVFLIAVEQLSIPITISVPYKENIALPMWTNINLPVGKVVANYPYYNEVDYLRLMQYDDRPTFNAYSGILPESTQRIMNSSFESKFFTDPFHNLTILADLNISYFILHKNLAINSSAIGLTNYNILSESLNTNSKVKKIITIEGDSIYDISGLKNPIFYLSNTTKTLRVINDKSIILTHTNPSGDIWVSKGLNTYNIRVDFIKKDKIYRSYTRIIYETLFLNAGDVYQTTFDISKNILDKFDRIEAKLL